MTAAEIFEIVLKFVSDLSDGWVGILGVVIGAILTTRAQRRSENVARQSEARYLAILVSAHLSRLARECRQVAYDDGTDEYGQPNGDHNGQPYDEPGAKDPQFEPLSIEGVNWKALDAELMRRVLEMPLLLEETSRRLHRWLDDSFPYWTSEWFLRRQLAYAQMAVTVVQLMTDVRGQVLGKGQAQAAQVETEKEESKKALEQVEQAWAAWNRKRAQRAASQAL